MILMTTVRAQYLLCVRHCFREIHSTTNISEEGIPAGPILAKKLIPLTEANGSSKGIVNSLYEHAFSKNRNCLLNILISFSIDPITKPYGLRSRCYSLNVGTTTLHSDHDHLPRQGD